jgi:hypothetical protein
MAAAGGMRIVQVRAMIFLVAPGALVLALVFFHYGTAAAAMLTFLYWVAALIAGSGRPGPGQ